MNIEELNKSQIVLLTLLVSFVTSIATGIVTVTLMDQAPPAITQTVNRVVERTVERVVPKETQTATVITKEKTVVVKESELIAQAVASAKPSSVRVYTEREGKDVLIGRAVSIADGYVVAGMSAEMGAQYMIATTDGTAPVTVVATDESNTLALLEIQAQEDEDGESYLLHTSPAPVNLSDLTLGQTVVALTGAGAVKVASGIVTSIEESPLDDSGDAVQESFETSVLEDAFISGSMFVNTDGSLIGIYSGSSQIVPASYAVTLLESLEDETIEEGQAQN